MGLPPEDDDREDIAMSSKLYAAMVPLLAVAAFVALPMTAQAASHWYRCHEVAAGTGKYQDAGCTKKATGNFELTRLPFETETATISVAGRLTFLSATWDGLVCSVTGDGKIWNTNVAVAGKGEVQGFEFYECNMPSCKKGLAATSEGLPWSTELLSGPPIRSKLTGVKIRIKCEEPTFNVLFTGELKPEWVNGNPSLVEFDSESGSLASSDGALTFAGHIAVESSDDIQVFSP
jgi:hypothetical protein